MNLDPALKYHPGISQAGRFINECAIPQMDVKLAIPFASTSWWGVHDVIRRNGKKQWKHIHFQLFHSTAQLKQEKEQSEIANPHQDF